MKMNVKLWVALIFLLGGQFANGQESDGIVRLHGKLRNFGGPAPLEDFSDLQHIAPLSHNRVIEMGADSSFAVEIKIKAPGYYRLGRNKLYLTPGDDMETLIDQANSTQSWFRGKGSEANNYLRYTTFPKGGSFLEMGKNLKSTPDSTFSTILSEASKRTRELNGLQKVSASFRRLENARIKADILKSIDAVDDYLWNRFGKTRSSESLEQFKIEFRQITKHTKDSLLTDFADPEFLQIEVYRDIINEIDLLKIRDAGKRQVFQDWQRSVYLAFRKIKPEHDKKALLVYRDSINAIRTARYREVLNQLLAEKMKFGNGDMAIDLMFRQTDGTEVRLSRLKGKVIYIDIWATWCGPCMAEMPHFEALKKKYQEEEDLAIVSLSVDDNDAVWLRDLSKRKPEGIQWRINRANLKEYELETVPRYILIDKNFVIAEMNAPRSSDPRTSTLIDNLLKK